MALKNLPVWPFEPNWNNRVNETLEWLTDILRSPSGSEQRRSLRALPRRKLDFTVLSEETERSLLDNLLVSYSGRDWYLPLWHDVRTISQGGTPTFLPCRTRGLRVGTPIFVAGKDPYDYQVTEFVAFVSGGMTVDPPLSAPPAIGTLVFPMAVARLAEEPSQTAITDTITTAEVQFNVTEYVSAILYPSPEAAGLSDQYRGFYVLTRESDWSDRGEFGQERLLDTFDANTGKTEQYDTANRPFPTQKHHWLLEEYEDHLQFYHLMHLMRGRAMPLWVPTWMGDMRLVEPVASFEVALLVERCGFTMAGGPRPERQDIMIELLDGRRFYRRIVSSAGGANVESLQLSSSLGERIEPKDVMRISFISLMRLNHDAVEINHITDLEGVSQVSVTFRAAPDTRAPI